MIETDASNSAFCSPMAARPTSEDGSKPGGSEEIESNSAGMVWRRRGIICGKKP